MDQTYQPLKGFRDLLPQEAKKRQWVKDIMVAVAEKWGYEPIETPTLEPLALFQGEVGEDEKLFFKFEDQGGRRVALRYDQTVPTCRFVGNHYSSLTFPFRRYQYQNVFRAEKPQRGRYREFTQFDLDVFGVKNPTADAEVIALNLETYLKIGFKSPLIIFNSRDLMKDIPYQALVAIDKLKKIGPDAVKAEMLSKGISSTQINNYLEQVANLKPDETISTITTYLENAGFSQDYYRFEPTLVRSFSYSQGPIWEIVINDYEAGSVGGGERYDGMMKRISGFDIPATGVAYGFDRTVEAADQLNLIPPLLSVKILISLYSPELIDYALKVTTQIRQKDIACEIYPTDAKLAKQFKYANQKAIPFVIVIGPNEAAKNLITLKNMSTGEQVTDTLENLVPQLKT